MPNAPESKKRPWVQPRKKQQRAVNMDWFYQDKRWRKFSKAYKQRHPLCIECDKEGVATPSQVTDHIVRYLDGGLGFDLDNLNDEFFNPLCNKHHNSKSGKESHGFKRGMG